MRRRTLLARSATALGASALATGTTGVASTGRATTQDSSNRTTSKLLPGTKYETEVVTIDAPKDGPTAVVVGGIHGDEPSGIRAASEVATWSFGAGTVVVLPRANRPAIERGTRENDDGDLNRKFPPGSEPETKLARAIWSMVEAQNPDVVLDLHSSKGIYRTHYSSVGQAIFPSAVEPAPGYARETVDTVNEDVVPWYMPYHKYTHAHLIDGDSPLLIHKVVGDLELPGYIVESTKFLLDARRAARWTAIIAETLLGKHGLERRGDR